MPLSVEIAIILNLVFPWLKFSSTVLSVNSSCSLRMIAYKWLHVCSDQNVSVPQIGLQDLPHIFPAFPSGLQRQDSCPPFLSVFQVFQGEQDYQLGPTGGPWKPLCEPQGSLHLILGHWAKSTMGSEKGRWLSIARGPGSVSIPSASSPMSSSLEVPFL